MKVFFVLVIVAFCFAAICPVAVDSYRLVPGWQLRASTVLPQRSTIRIPADIQLRCKQIDADTVPGATDAGRSGGSPDQPDHTDSDEVTLVSAPEFAGIDSEDFYDYNDEDSDDVASDTGTDEYVSSHTKSYKAELERSHDYLIEQEQALKEKEELLATEYTLLKKLQTLRDRGEFVHDDLRAKEELCKTEESLCSQLRDSIRSIRRGIEETEWRLEQSRDADEEKNVLRRRKKLRQDLMNAAERDAWLGINDQSPISTSDPASLAVESVVTQVETPPAVQADADVLAPVIAIAAEAVKAVKAVKAEKPEEAVKAEVAVMAAAHPVNVKETEKAASAPADMKANNPALGTTSWDWQAVRSWDETTASATAVDAGWVALRSAVLLSLGLVDVATGYVTSTEVAEVVQAVVGTGTSLVDIAQSAGDAWQSGAELWRAQVADSLDSQSSIKDVLVTTCIGAKTVFCSPPVRKALGHIGKTVATTATSVVTSGVHTSQRVRREFEASEQWNKGVKGLKASVPLLCALGAAGAVKGVEEVIKSML